MSKKKNQLNKWFERKRIYPKIVLNFKIQDIKTLT